MAPSSNLLRTTTVQAFAQTLVDPSVRPEAITRRGVGTGAAAGEESRGGAADRASQADLPSVGDVVGGHYKLVRLLGQGTFGKVYVAQRLDVPEHQVALKLLPRSLYAGRNVERELVMLATVGHPHVVQLKDHGTTRDYVWLTMPVYQGETLAERLEKKGTLSPRQAYDIFLPMARGLEALHAAGLRHQDVKPENIFLAVFGGRVHPVLLDLGVAAERDATFVAGTALYGAPEQVAALSGLAIQQALSEKMDTYGLAATLLMSLVGPKHFPGERAENRAELAIAQDVRTTEPIGMGALPEVTGDPRDQLAGCFRHWLAFSADDRPTMRELAEQLEVLLEPDAEEVRLEERRRARQRRTIQGLGGTIAGMFLVGVAGGAVVWNQRETLRIAADLDRARSAGARSFDELGTCNAAHAEDTRALAECRATSERTRDEYRQQLDEVMRSGSTTQAEHAREAQRYMTRLKACDEAATTQKRASDDEIARILLDTARDKQACATEREEAERRAESLKGTLAARDAERDQCRAERSSCVEERDALKALVVAAAARPGPGARPIATQGTSAPAVADPAEGAPREPPREATAAPKVPTPPPAPPAITPSPPATPPSPPPAPLEPNGL